jgi:hypothetical protein
MSGHSTSTTAPPGIRLPGRRRMTGDVRGDEDALAEMRASVHGPQDARTAENRATIKPQAAAACISTSQGANTWYLVARA